MVLSNGTSMKGARVNGAATSIGGEEFQESCVKIVGNERGDDVLIAIRDDKEVMRTDGVEVVLPT